MHLRDEMPRDDPAMITVVEAIQTMRQQEISVVFIVVEL
jgi:hypothetical protein